MPARSRNTRSPDARQGHPSRRPRRPLSTRFVAIVVLSELAFGVVLFGVLSAYSVRNIRTEHEAGISHLASAIAASVMPMVADQDTERVNAQLRSIVTLSSEKDIVCIELNDTSGALLADSGPCTCDLVRPAANLIQVFTTPEVVVRPVVIDGLEVASVSVQFAPMGLEQALLDPLKAAALIVLAAIGLSAVWIVALMLRSVVEPIAELRDGAIRVAAGDRLVGLAMDRPDEIGELAQALDDMKNQLQSSEERLLASYDSLRDAYENQERMKDRLERSVRMKSDFVAIASHELRTPLAVIRLYAEMMERGVYGQLDDRMREAVDAVVDASHRLSSIVSSLMDVALIERGLVLLDFGDVDVPTLVADAARDAGFAGAARDVRVRVSGELPEIVIRGDRLRLRQVLDNLLSNAVKYSRPSSAVVVSVRVKDGWLTIAVADDGPGVPAERREELFEPFVRLDVSDDAEATGLGLGLPVAKRITQAHGGDVTVSDGEAGGAVFEVRLPLQRPEAEEARAGRSGSCKGRGPCRRCRQARGYYRRRRPRTGAWSHGTAVERGSRRHLSRQRPRSGGVGRSPAPDLVVLDVMMPFMDGWEVLSRIRANPVLDRLPVMMLTAKGTEDAKVRGFNLGADDSCRSRSASPSSCAGSRRCCAEGDSWSTSRSRDCPWSTGRTSRSSPCPRSATSTASATTRTCTRTTPGSSRAFGFGRSTSVPCPG